MVKRSQVIVESLTGVKKVDLGVRPDPGTLLIGLIMPYGRAQDHDVLKEPPVGAFEQTFLLQGDAYCRAMPQSTSLPRPTPDRRAFLDCRVGWGSPRW